MVALCRIRQAVYAVLSEVDSAHLYITWRTWSLWCVLVDMYGVEVQPVSRMIKASRRMAKPSGGGFNCTPIKNPERQVLICVGAMLLGAPI